LIPDADEIVDFDILPLPDTLEDILPPSPVSTAA